MLVSSAPHPLQMHRASVRGSMNGLVAASRVCACMQQRQSLFWVQVVPEGESVLANVNGC